MGGNRYIGLNLVFELAHRGHEVTVMNSHEAPLPEGARRLHGDRQVPGTITEVLGPHRDEFDAVFDNTAYHVTDLAPIIELFAGRVQHFAFTSSVAVYRRTFVQPVRETFRTHDPHDTAAVKAYGVGKVQCEQYLDGLFHDHGLPYTVFRVAHMLMARDVPFVFATGSGRDAIEPAFAGAPRIEKPISPAALERALVALMAGRHA